MDNVWSSYELGPAPPATTHIAVVAANSFPTGWESRSNPASILLSSEPDANGDMIVTDTTWKCETYPLFDPQSNGQVNQRAWPVSSDVVTKTGELKASFDTSLEATEVSPILYPLFIDRIQLGAKRIWYAGLNKEGNEAGIAPSNNVICMKKL